MRSSQAWQDMKQGSCGAGWVLGFGTVLGCREASDPTVVRAPRALVRDGGAPTLRDDELRARIPGLRAGDRLSRLALRAPLDVVIVRVVGEGVAPRVWAIDDARAYEGLAGASRIVGAWRALGYTPFTDDLARVVGAFTQPDATVVEARTVVALAEGPRWVAAPTLAPDPDGEGSLLGFGYVRDGALHTARFRVTVTGAVVALAGRR